MEIALYILIGFLVGLSLSLIWANSRKKAENQKFSDLDRELQETRIKKSENEKEVSILKEAIQKEENQNSELQTELTRLINENATSRETNKNLIEKLEGQKKELQEMKEQFKAEFENLAQKIFDEKSEKFAKQNKSSLDLLLDPLKERLKEFQKKVEETHINTVEQNTGLREELKNIKELSQLMTDEASNLTKALKNDSKTQGNWGEMILESILESSGLTKNQEYFVQQSYTDDSGRRLQPDVEIKLPEDKWIVVDSKVSLTAYERYHSAESESDRQAALREHLKSLRTHFKALSEKRYNQLSDGKKLDFTLMFVPVEPAYLIALNEDQKLFNEAYERGVVMVSPSTLIASLKIIAATWKHEKQNKNAQEIAERGKLLLEKFINFTEDFEKVGDQINRTERAYQDAMNKLKSGRGNLVSQSHKLIELGIKTDKQLSNTLIESDDED